MELEFSTSSSHSIDSLLHQLRGFFFSNINDSPYTGPSCTHLVTQENDH